MTNTKAATDYLAASGATAIISDRPERRWPRGIRPPTRPKVEALRRAGHVERVEVDHWRVPADLPEHGHAYDLARDGANIRVSILSPTGLGAEIGYEGATWLDRELVSPQRMALTNEGFGEEVKVALEKRKQALANMGHVNDLGDGHVHTEGFDSAAWGRRHRAPTGKALAAERGLK